MNGLSGKFIIKIRLISLLFVLCIPLILAGAVPEQVHYKGRLLENGVEVSGSRDFTFGIFSVPSGGLPLWTSGVRTLMVSEGDYEYIMGSAVPVPSAVFTNGSLWLEIAVNGIPLVPRERFKTVPYSFRTGMVKGDNTFPSSGNTGIGVSDPTNALEVNGTLSAGRLKGKGVMPVGTIAMWHGPVADLPPNFRVCDGTGTYTVNGNTYPVPDLRDRFIVSAGGSYGRTAAGGLNAAALSVNGLPSHNHGGSTSTTGNHTHPWNRGLEGDDSLFGGSNDEYTRTGGVVNDTIGWAGNHNHSIPSQGANQAHENRPPYYALYYIIRVD